MQPPYKHIPRHLCTDRGGKGNDLKSTWGGGGGWFCYFPFHSMSFTNALVWFGDPKATERAEASSPPPNTHRHTHDLYTAVHLPWHLSSAHSSLHVGKRNEIHLIAPHFCLVISFFLRGGEGGEGGERGPVRVKKCNPKHVPSSSDLSDKQIIFWVPWFGFRFGFGFPFAGGFARSVGFVSLSCMAEQRLVCA